MFNWATSWLGSMSTPLKNVITAVLLLAAIGFIVKPAAGAMQDFGGKKYGAGIANILAILAIMAVAVSATVFIYAAGKKTGDELNSTKAGAFNFLFTVAPALWLIWQAKLHRKQLTADKL